jgi:hypothetical protein
MQPEPGVREDTDPEARVDDNDTRLATTASGGGRTNRDNKLTYHRDLEGGDGDEREKGEVERKGQTPTAVSSSQNHRSRGRRPASSSGEASATAMRVREHRSRGVH